MTFYNPYSEIEKELESGKVIYICSNKDIYKRLLIARLFSSNTQEETEIKTSYSLNGILVNSYYLFKCFMKTNRYLENFIFQDNGRIIFTFISGRFWLFLQRSNYTNPRTIEGSSIKEILLKLQ